jgi:hypothetical protein
MARTSVSTTEKQNTRHEARRKAKIRRSAVALAALGSILAIVRNCAPASCSKPRPIHTSILTGIGWVTELQSGHPERFQHQMGMSKLLFQKLLRELQAVTGLQDSKYVKIEEQVAIFLNFCVTGTTNRHLQERFQRSGDTISR